MTTTQLAATVTGIALTAAIVAGALTHPAATAATVGAVGLPAVLIPKRLWDDYAPLLTLLFVAIVLILLAPTAGAVR